VGELSAPPSWISRGLTVLLRPRLEISVDDKAVEYATVIYDGEAWSGKYLRAWVSNFGIGETARECSVYLEELFLNGEPVDVERSPLAWTHERGDAIFTPKSIPRGRRRGLQFDICKIDGKLTPLWFQTKKGSRGHQFFTESGTLVAVISAEAAHGTSVGRATFTIYYDHEAPDIQLRSFEARRKWFRIW
jgi:hypothetical protein